MKHKIKKTPPRCGGPSSPNSPPFCFGRRCCGSPRSSTPPPPPMPSSSGGMRPSAGRFLSGSSRSRSTPSSGGRPKQSTGRSPWTPTIPSYRPQNGGRSRGHREALRRYGGGRGLRRGSGGLLQSVFGGGKSRPGPRRNPMRYDEPRPHSPPKRKIIKQLERSLDSVGAGRRF